MSEVIYPEDKHVGYKIRAFRMAADMSQKEMAGRIGVSFQQVQKYENGKNKISAEKLLLVAKALGITVSELLEDNYTKDIIYDKDIARLIRFYRLIKSEELKSVLLYSADKFSKIQT